MINKKNLNVLNGHLKLLKKYMKEEGENYSYQNKSYYNNIRVKNQLNVVQGYSASVLSQLKGVIQDEFSEIMEKPAFRSPLEQDINRYISHIYDLIEIENAGEEEIEKGNIFLGVEEKMKRANESAKTGNKEGLFSCLHTAFEVLLKDKLGIALDMDGAKLGKVIRICLAKEVFLGKNSILKQINENICEIDNKMKHSGYDPSAKEMNDALLIGQQGTRILKDETPKMNDEIKEEISKILIKNN